MQVYDMSVLRAAQRHPRRRLPTDVPRPAPEQSRSASEKNHLHARFSLSAMLQAPILVLPRRFLIHLPGRECVWGMQEPVCAANQFLGNVCEVLPLDDVKPEQDVGLMYISRADKSTSSQRAVRGAEPQSRDCCAS